MRLIDADRLLSDRMKSKYYHLPNGDIVIPIIDIEHAPTVATDINVPGKWISVEDRLPDDTKPVYVWLGQGSGLRSGIPFVGRYDPFVSGVWRIYGLDGDRPDIIKITHWMPLPEPPEEEKQNEA